LLIISYYIIGSGLGIGLVSFCVLQWKPGENAPGGRPREILQWVVCQLNFCLYKRVSYRVIWLKLLYRAIRVLSESDILLMLATHGCFSALLDLPLTFDTVAYSVPFCHSACSWH